MLCYSAIIDIGHYSIVLIVHCESNPKSAGKSTVTCQRQERKQDGQYLFLALPAVGCLRAGTETRRLDIIHSQGCRGISNSFPNRRLAVGRPPSIWLLTKGYVWNEQSGISSVRKTELQLLLSHPQSVVF